MAKSVQYGGWDFISTEGHFRLRPNPTIREVKVLLPHFWPYITSAPYTAKMCLWMSTGSFCVPKGIKKRCPRLLVSRRLVEGRHSAAHVASAMRYLNR